MLRHFAYENSSQRIQEGTLLIEIFALLPFVTFARNCRSVVRGNVFYLLWNSLKKTTTLVVLSHVVLHTFYMAIFTVITTNSRGEKLSQGCRGNEFGVGSHQLVDSGKSLSRIIADTAVGWFFNTYVPRRELDPSVCLRMLPFVDRLGVRSCCWFVCIHILFSVKIFIKSKRSHSCVKSRRPGTNCRRAKCVLARGRLALAWANPVQRWNTTATMILIASYSLTVVVVVYDVSRSIYMVRVGVEQNNNLSLVCGSGS